MHIVEIRAMESDPGILHNTEFLYNDNNADVFGIKIYNIYVCHLYLNCNCTKLSNFYHKNPIK